MDLSGVKIVHVGSYSDPNAPGGNNLLWTQVKYLTAYGSNSQIVTWPRPHAWTGLIPTSSTATFAGVPLLKYRRDSISYIVIDPPFAWGKHVSSEEYWHQSVDWAKKLLLWIKPDIVHQHFWQRCWFLMEAAIQLNIPTVYTAYDWGLPCRQQFLVRGDGTPCDLVVTEDECLKCCHLNIERHDLKDVSMIDQIRFLHSRWSTIARNLSAFIAPSLFAKQFYESVGVPSNVIKLLPWFYGQDISCLRNRHTVHKPVRIGFLGRIVPEKGLDIIFNALKHLHENTSIELEIAGLITGNYAVELRNTYATQAGPHKIVWSGWIPNVQLGTFFDRIDVLVVPSRWYDNTPTVLGESLAHGCPVICTDLPSFASLIMHETNGLLFTMGHGLHLALAIDRFVNERGLASCLRTNARYSRTADVYTQELSRIYKAIL